MLSYQLHGINRLSNALTRIKERMPNLIAAPRLIVTTNSKKTKL